MRRAFFASMLVFLGVATLSLLHTSSVSANSLSISPLQYKSKLAIGESKKGFIDVVNPSATEVEIKLKVQAFRQIDDQGGLEFYDNDAVSKGVKLDLTNVKLLPREGVRVYFILDGTVLPNGDVFAAIFASTVSVNDAIVSIPAAQVGTLLLLENGNPTAHNATIKSFDAHWFQLGEAVNSQITINNTDPPGGKAIGFFPEIKFSLKPYNERTIDGPLLFAGRTRVVDYKQNGDYFGPILVQATVGGQTESRLIFAVTGYWQWLAPLILVTLIAITIFLRYFLQKHKINRGRKTGHL